MSADEDLTTAIVRTALEVRLDDLPASAVEAVELAVLDCLACAVVGSRVPGVDGVARWAVATGGRPESTVVGTDLRTSPPLAALANAVAAHALDYDDVSLRMTHPSVSLVPVLLALGEQVGMSGRALLEAYVAGFEVEARICRVLNPEHYDRGWHTTGTIGVLGSAMAAARAYGLDLPAARHALAIAASTASGLRKNFGTLVKPLHAGQSCLHGLEAAGLARNGVVADDAIMEGPSSYLRVFSTDEAAPMLREVFAPGAEPEMVASGIGLKRFACCGAIHPALDAVLDLAAGEPFDPADVVRVEVRVNPITPRILIHHVTQRGLEGKFSMEYSVAVCMMDGRAGLGQYTDERAADPRLLDLMRKVDVVVDDTIPVNLAFFPSVVTIELAGGRTLRARVDVPKGYPEDPFGREEVVAKAHECCDGILADEQVDLLVGTVTDLRSCPDVAVLAGALAVGGGR